MSVVRVTTILTAGVVGGKYVTGTGRRVVVVVIGSDFCVVYVGKTSRTIGFG